jgi:hypothetical protein
MGMTFGSRNLVCPSSVHYRLAYFEAQLTVSVFYVCGVAHSANFVVKWYVFIVWMIEADN